MRVVVDTNIFVSAALKDNSLPTLAVRLVQERGTFLKSGVTEAQFHEVLERPYLARLITMASLDWLNRVMASAELVAVTESIAACRDPTDDKFLEVAVSGRADLILSGDADLLVLDPFRGIPILSAAVFLQTVSSA